MRANVKERKLSSGMTTKIIASVLISIMVSLSSISVAQLVPAARANFLGPPPGLAPAVIVSIKSPTGAGRYAQDNVTLTFNLEFPKSPSRYPYYAAITGVRYSVDGKLSPTSANDR